MIEASKEGARRISDALVQFERHMRIGIASFALGNFIIQVGAAAFTIYLLKHR